MDFKIGLKLPNPTQAVQQAEQALEKAKAAVESAAKGVADAFERNVPVFFGAPSPGRLEVSANDWQPGSNDPFEPKAICPEGPYKGQRYDVSAARSVHVLSPQEAAKYGAKPGELLVANVWHDGHWYIARIPPDGVQDVVLQGEHVDNLPFAGHTQMRFTMKPGQEVELIPQVPGDEAPPASLHDLVFSAESIGVPGEPFDLVQGNQDKFGMSYRMMGLDDKVQIMTHDGKMDSVDQWRLNLTDAQKQAVLKSAVQEGSDAGLTRMYNTLNRSCSTEAFRAIDAALHYDNPVLDVVAPLTPGNLPPLDGAYLAERGLLGPNSAMPKLEDELASR